MDTRMHHTWKNGRLIAMLGGTVQGRDCLTALTYLVRPGAMIRGAAIAEYERAFARQVGVAFAQSFASGRVALFGLLNQLGVGPGDEVLLQVPTHIVVANAIRYTGAIPVYVDCRPDTWNMDLQQARRLITPKTKVLLVQHTFGIPNDMDEVLALSRKHGLIVLEDCVHALGAEYKGRPVGSFGRAAFFSTEETKIISTTMGGMAVTDDAALAAQMLRFQSTCPWPPRHRVFRYLLKLVMYYFLTEPRVHRYARAIYEGLGNRMPLPRPTVKDELMGLRPKVYEQRLSNAQAVLGLRQLRTLAANLAHRRMIADLYRRDLGNTSLGLPRPPEQSTPAYVRYPVFVPDRQKAVAALKSLAVPGTWFTSVLEEAESPEYGGYVAGSCPRAEEAARHLVNLPTHQRACSRDAAALAAALRMIENTP